MKKINTILFLTFSILLLVPFVANAQTPEGITTPEELFDYAKANGSSTFYSDKEIYLNDVKNITEQYKYVYLILFKNKANTYFYYSNDPIIIEEVPDGPYINRSENDVFMQLTSSYDQKISDDVFTFKKDDEIPLTTINNEPYTLLVETTSEETPIEPGDPVPIDPNPVIDPEQLQQLIDNQQLLINRFEFFLLLFIGLSLITLFHYTRVKP